MFLKSANMSTTNLVNNFDILSLLPHREPFLFIDEVLNFDSLERAIFCSFTMRDDNPIFKGHFPNNPVLPGVLQIEMCAQAAIILLKNIGFLYKWYLLVGINNVKYFRPIKPNQKVIIESKFVKHKLNIFFSDSKIVAENGDLIMSCNITCAAKNEEI
jgi:3-hydroxyacyl-[acyl-carrier-protein] dehydratase